MLTVRALDHIVLRSPGVERSLHFYGDVLGMAPARVAEWHAGIVSFPSVRVSPETIIGLFPQAELAAPREQQWLDHSCLVVNPVEMSEAIKAVEEAGMWVDLQATWLGARGQGCSCTSKGQRASPSNCATMGAPRRGKLGLACGGGLGALDLRL